MTENPFQPGELCLLIDNRGRRYLQTLTPAGAFEYHNGNLAHAEIIGRPEGSVLRSTKGGRLIALRPRLADYILRMKRGAQVVYPKDIGPLLVWGDIGPGMRVLEAGTGSGALTIALLRAVGDGGEVVSVERRSDHAAHARQTIEKYFGSLPSNLQLVEGNVEEILPSVHPERVVLDLPEPFSAIPAAAASLTPGGVLCAYVPTIPQVQQTAEALRMSGAFADVTHFEVFQREWNIEGRSVRPNHQMVGHTGFITVARKIVFPETD